MRDTLVIVPTVHCIERFHERVKPALSPYAAAAELFRLMADFGRLSTQAPSWAEDASEPEAWLLLSDDIALPISGGRALSCITRSNFSQGERTYRSRAKKTAKGAKRSAGRGDTRNLKRERKANRAPQRRWDVT